MGTGGVIGFFRNTKNRRYSDFNNILYFHVKSKYLQSRWAFQPPTGGAGNGVGPVIGGGGGGGPLVTDLLNNGGGGGGGILLGPLYIGGGGGGGGIQLPIAGKVGMVLPGSCKKGWGGGGGGGGRGGGGVIILSSCCGVGDGEKDKSDEKQISGVDCGCGGEGVIVISESGKDTKIGILLLGETEVFSFVDKIWLVVSLVDSAMESGVFCFLIISSVWFKESAEKLHLMASTATSGELNRDSLLWEVLLDSFVSKFGDERMLKAVLFIEEPLGVVNIGDISLHTRSFELIGV